MSSKALTNPDDVGRALEQVIVNGDLSVLQPADRTKYYNTVCESLGLNPYTRPFAYIKLQGQLRLYAQRDCTDQLRRLRGVSIEVAERAIVDGSLVVHVRAVDRDGRRDEDFGIVPIAGLKGDAAANAMMKAITKAKRRVTLSICGLGWLDESEVSSVPGAQLVAEQEPLAHSRKAIAPPDIPDDIPPPAVADTPEIPQASDADFLAELDERLTGCGTVAALDKAVADHAPEVEERGLEQEANNLVEKHRQRISAASMPVQEKPEEVVRAEEEYVRIMQALRAIERRTSAKLVDLQEVWKAEQEALKALPDNWRKQIETAKDAVKAKLQGKAA